MASTPSFLVSDPWKNQRITLYHGTIDYHANSINKKILLTMGRTNTDFGQGFYTTTVLDQAKSWAWDQLCRQQKNKLYSHLVLRATVLKFEVERDGSRGLSSLESLWFVLGNRDAKDYWSFVTHCRQGYSPSPTYDIVVGPVASQWRQRQTIHDADQIGFHTQDAIDVLEAGGPPSEVWRYP